LEPLCDSILAKIHEQIERTDHLVGLLSPGQLNWTPEIPGAWSTGQILNHILDCLGGICAFLMAVYPEQLAYFQRLREERIDRPRDGLVLFQKHIDQGFVLLKDSDLSKPIPTVFVKSGEPVMTLLLGNLEHLINHKHQLFMYLKLMGASVASRDLYHFRTEI
jgi:uncharacterized damage-inducible protein DinB